jgi:hypothetical protein
MHVLPAPAILGPEIVVHDFKSVVHATSAGQMKRGIGGSSRESCTPPSFLISIFRSAQEFELAS